MDTEKTSQPKRRRKTGKRIIQIVSALIVILIIFVFVLVPVLVSSEKGRQIILAKINKSIEGRADFSDLSMGWFKGIRIADLSFDDNAGEFSVKVKRIATEPHYGSLLTGNLSFGQTTIDEPRVQINLKEKPPVENTFAAEPKSVPKEAAGIKLVTDITVNDGNVKVTDTDDKTVELAQINSNINLKPTGKQSSFDLNMIVAANDKESKIKAEGRITPAKTKEKSGWTFEAADGDLIVEVNDLDLESLESFFALAGVDIQTKGDISANLKGQLINGQIENVTGTVKGTNLDITTAALKGDHLKTSVLDADIYLARKGQMMNINNLNVKTDWANLQATGSLPTTIESMDSFLVSDSNYDFNGTFNCNIATLASQMPNTIGLKEGTTISSGIINGTIKTATQAGKKQIQADAELTNLKGLVEGKEVSLSQPIRTSAQVSPDKTGINIDNFDLTASFAQINAAGNLDQIKFTAQADMARMQSEFGQFVDIGPYKIAGQLTEAGEVSLTDKTISLSASSTVKGLNITGPNNVTASVPTGQATYVFNYDRDNSVLNINSLDAGMSFGRVNIKDAVVPLKKEASEAFDMTVNAQQIDLNKLRPFAVLFGGIPEKTVLAGIAESEISVTSQQQVYKIKSDSTKIANLKFAYPENKPFEQKEVSMGFDAEIDPVKKRFKLNGCRLDSPQFKIRKGTFSMIDKDGKTKLTGQVDLQYDWSALRAIVGPYLPEDLVLKGTRKDRISFVSEYPINETNKILPNLNTTAELGFEQAGYKGLNFGPTDVNIIVKNGLLKIDPFSTTVNEGWFNFSAQADFKVQPAVFKVPLPMHIIKDVRINDMTTQKLLKYINPIFADAANVNGIANMNCETLSIPLSAVAKNKAEIVGTFSVNQLRLETSDFLGQLLSVVGGGARGTIITIHPTRFVLRNGFLRYDDMQMDIGDNPVNFKGVIGLDKSLEMSVTLPYTTEGRTIRTGSTSGRRITLPITGTVDNPKLDVGKLLENQIKQEAEEQLRNVLEDIFK